MILLYFIFSITVVTLFQYVRRIACDEWEGADREEERLDKIIRDKTRKRLATAAYTSEWQEERRKFRTQISKLKVPHNLFKISFSVAYLGLFLAFQASWVIVQDIEFFRSLLEEGDERRLAALYVIIGFYLNAFLTFEIEKYSKLKNDVSKVRDQIRQLMDFIENYDRKKATDRSPQPPPTKPS